MSKLPVPSHGNKPLIQLLPWIIIGLAFFYFLAGFTAQKLSVFDEGFIAHSAERVLRGDLPYKDFWSPYPPAQFYVVGALFKVFGISIMTERLYGIVIIFLMAVISYLIMLRVSSKNTALFTWTGMVIFLETVTAHSYPYPVPMSILLGLSGSLLMMKYFDPPHKKKLLFFSGLLIGASALFRHDIGFYSFAGAATTAGLYAFFHLTPANAPLIKRCFLVLRQSAWFLLGTCTSFLPVAVWMVWNIPIYDIYDQLFYSVAVSNVKARWLPFPTPRFYSPIPLFRTVPFYFPLALFFVTGIYLALKLRTPRVFSKESRLWPVLMILLTGCLYVLQAKVRSDHSHIMPMFIPASILFAALFSMLAESKKTKLLVWAVAGMILFSVSANAAIRKKDKMMKSLFSDAYVPYQLDRAKGMRKLRGNEIEEVIRYVQGIVPREERIFVGNYRHDKVNVSHVMFYFLANRQSSTKYQLFEPGLVTAEKIQKEMILELQKHKVNVIVLWEDFHPKEPNLSSKSSGITLLDDYIKANYAPDRTFKTFKIFKKIS